MRDGPEGKTSKVEQEEEEEEREQRQQEKEQVESIVPDGGAESEGVISRATTAGVDRRTRRATSLRLVDAGRVSTPRRQLPVQAVEDNNNFGPLEESRVVEFIAYLWDPSTRMAMMHLAPLSLARCLEL